jgi:hypothetical protein
MMTEDLPICAECGMPFDWPEVESEGNSYCCEACSLGEPCTCPQHEHASLESDVPLPSAMAGQLGIGMRENDR